MNKFIDHTYLSPQASAADIKRLCQEAIDHEFYAVCVPPYFVAKAKQALHDQPVKVATVIGYPYGYSETSIKVAEARRSLEEGADELDIVINISAVKSGDWNYVRTEIEQMATTVRLKGKVCKLILEMGVLTDEELGRLVDLCNKVRPDFVKTSSGTQGGATVDQVRFLRANLDSEIRIKASGGIRTRTSATELLEAGADRIGTSSALSIIQ
ncbi:deoxyribose-phosphate aldolase [Neolewinella xylanilytica]|uniref:Deoxyribose-phosphate aldolase n=1 Tax=Neolewinella xylanilytica TaxID=1514080 RepID=A0A2S6I1R5_9BACT|nr:deoxyribose-phosphate aldolase [Neolewinella xylanilytica]PPK85100.1 deoxyribose-phosphate aldolase [Neolewinella xylanilytica]